MSQANLNWLLHGLDLPAGFGWRADQALVYLLRNRRVIAIFSAALPHASLARGIETLLRQYSFAARSVSLH